MSNVDNNLNQILQIEPAEIVQEPKKEKQIVKVESGIKDDFDYSRSNYYNLIEKGNEALDNLLEVAKESQHPRAYEVAANMLKNLSDMTDKLMILQKQKKDLEGNQSANEKNINIDKAVVFAGSTTDLLKQTRKIKDDSLHNLQNNKQN